MSHGIVSGAALVLLCQAFSVGAESWRTQVRDRYPSLSPDGTRLLFESDRNGAKALYLASPSGADVRLLIGGGGEPTNGSWCPDGKRIVFNQIVGGEFDVFIINADGSGLRNLTNSAVEESHPHCGRDDRIYFNSDRNTPDRSVPWGERDHDLYSIAPDGTGLVRLTDCKGVCTNPNPSPDGTKVAFRYGLRSPGVSWAQEPDDFNSDIAVLDLQTKRIVNIANNPAYDTWPSWSPDGAWVVYGSNRDGVANVGHLYLTSVDGARTRKLTSGPASYGEPRFSPDGKTLYFSKSLPASGSRASFIASTEFVPE